jgi:hypothetical protein
MEFEEIQEIWDLQKKQTMYTINEKELHSRILLKKNQAGHITNISELMLIIVNAGAALVVIGLNTTSRHWNFFMYLMAAWMLGTAGYMVFSRVRRIRTRKGFSMDMRGNLEHAIADARYQVRISQLMRLNMVPLALFILLGYWEGSKSIWVAVGTVVFFAIAYYVSGFEQRCYRSRRRELESLYDKLGDARG